MRSISVLFLLVICLAGCQNLASTKDVAAKEAFLKIKAKLEKTKSASLVAVVRGDEYVDDTKYSIDIKDGKHYQAEYESIRITADGESVYTVDNSEKYYDRSAISDEAGFGLCELWGLPVFDDKKTEGKLETYSFATLGDERILRRQIGSEGDQVNVFYSLKTGLPLGFRHEQSIPLGGSFVVEAKYRKVELNPILSDNLFVFAKPKGYRFMSDRLENVTFKIGDTFPTPAISFIGSRYRSVEDMAKLNNAVLVIFWSHG